MKKPMRLAATALVQRWRALFGKNAPRYLSDRTAELCRLRGRTPGAKLPYDCQPMARIWS